MIALSPRTKFVLMFVLFALPFVASYLAYFFWTPSRTSNFGELMRPVVPLPVESFRALAEGDIAQPLAKEGLRGKWLMVTRDASDCAAPCETKLYSMRQTRQILGREQTRLARVVLSEDGQPPRRSLDPVFAGTVWVDAANSSWLGKLPKEANDASNGRGYFYLVDPMGNLFMRYPATADVKQMAADLKRVLKASQTTKDFEK